MFHLQFRLSLGDYVLILCPCGEISISPINLTTLPAHLGYLRRAGDSGWQDLPLVVLSTVLAILRSSVSLYILV